MRKLEINQVASRGAELGFLLLSTEYVGSKIPLLWACKNGHQFQLMYNGIDQGYGCQKCGRAKCGDKSRTNVATLEKLAAARGGQYLSGEKYQNCMSKVEWRCGRSHIFLASANRVQQGQWCGDCAVNKKKDLAWCRSLAKKRGGVCLASVYVNGLTSVQWRCAKGHEWSAWPHAISGGRWCPQCAKKCDGFETDIFETVRSAFPDAKRNVLGVLRNRLFELDIYIPSLKLAVECDGENWHQKPAGVDRDSRKTQECHEAGVRLLRIGYRASNRCRGEPYRIAKEKLIDNIRTVEQELRKVA